MSQHFYQFVYLSQLYLIDLSYRILWLHGLVLSAAKWCREMFLWIRSCCTLRFWRRRRSWCDFIVDINFVELFNIDGQDESSLSYLLFWLAAYKQCKKVTTNKVKLYKVTANIYVTVTRPVFFSFFRQTNFCKTFLFILNKESKFVNKYQIFLNVFPGSCYESFSQSVCLIKLFWPRKKLCLFVVLAEMCQSVLPLNIKQSEGVKYPVSDIYLFRYCNFQNKFPLNLTS